MTRPASLSQAEIERAIKAAIKAGERAADLLDVAEEGPTEYERKVAQMREDFPNGI